MLAAAYGFSPSLLPRADGAYCELFCCESWSCELRGWSCFRLDANAMPKRLMNASCVLSMMNQTSFAPGTLLTMLPQRPALRPYSNQMRLDSLRTCYS